MSGGEAQRVKLATELSRRATGRTVYILDEPTTGLSFEDTAALLEVLQALVEQRQHGDRDRAPPRRDARTPTGSIDLGPAGGAAGGYLLAEGTPEAIARHPESVTGRFLAHTLERDGAAKQPAARAKPTKRAAATPGPSKNGSRAKSNGANPEKASAAAARARKIARA